MISAGSTDRPVARPKAAARVARCADEKFVTTRYGSPRLRSSTTASGEPGMGAFRYIRTPSASRTNARTPPSAIRRSARRDDAFDRLRGIRPMVGSGRLGPRTTEDWMGLLDGRNALIFGVANDHSIAWGIARALHEQGATLGFSSVESLIERRVRPLASSIGATFVEPCDVQSDEQIAGVMAKWGEARGQIDVLVHAHAFAKREDLDGEFANTSRDGFALAMDVSAYSLVALVREARPLLREGSSVITLSYYGA